MHPPTFQSNTHYLGWEMGQLQKRLNTFIAAKEDPSQLGAYYDMAERLIREREVARGARREAADRGVEIPLETLSRRFSLSPTEEEVLMVCLAPHLSFTVWNLLVYAQGSVLKPHLEVGFVADLLDPPTNLLSRRQWCEPDAPLIRNGLLYTEAPRESSISTSVLSFSVQAPHYLASSILGRSPLDEQLTTFCELDDPQRELYDVILPLEVRQQAESLVRGFYRRNQLLDPTSRTWTVLVRGERLSGKTSLCEGLARAFQRPLFQVHLARMPRGQGASLLRLIERNARFLGAVVLLHQPELINASNPELLGVATEIIRHYPGVLILESHDPSSLAPSFEAAIQFVLDLGRPDPETRTLLWEALLPHTAEVTADVNLPNLASTYDLTGGQIQRAIAWGVQRAESRASDLVITQEDLVEGAKSQIRARLDELTNASTARLTLTDLVLAEEPMTEVREFLGACRARQNVMNEWGFARRLVTGRGLVALFTGEPGTGKTLTAEILATELGLRLQIVSIPKVVSKWVGETEKNIRQIFSNAKAQSAMLLFDEADSLFASRVKVERAQDHYQNMEVNNLLQEIERFDGIVILTTNLETNMDEAFQRRILFKIDFPVPEEEQRLAIWTKLIPKQTPISGKIDFGYLAHAYELTGGQIKNAVIRAAYRCYANGHGLDQQNLHISARQQATAAGRLAAHIDEFDDEDDF